jgi:hypothetical protein
LVAKTYPPHLLSEVRREAAYDKTAVGLFDQALEIQHQFVEGGRQVLLVNLAVYHV